MKIKKLIHGYGVNDVEFNISSKVDGRKVVDPIYRTWNDMLCRCYSVNNKKDMTYKDCSVNRQWKYLSSFYQWMSSKDFLGLHLDKDILNPANKEYGPEVCVFVPQYLNSLLTDRSNFRGQYPLGVTYIKKTPDMVNEMNKPFKARINNGFGKKIELGNFRTPEEAHKAWQKGKAEVIEQQVLRYMFHRSYNQQVANALSERADKLRNSADLGIITESL